MQSCLVGEIVGAQHAPRAMQNICVVSFRPTLRCNRKKIDPKWVRSTANFPKNKRAICNSASFLLRLRVGSRRPESGGGTHREGLWGEVSPALAPRCTPCLLCAPAPSPGLFEACAGCVLPGPGPNQTSERLFSLWFAWFRWLTHR